jgi:nucleotide-binding universal stress UspA family protein
MNPRPGILCPIDYSDASAASLLYGAAVAEHFVTRLIVLNVEDALLAAAMDLSTGASWSREQSAHDMAAFVRETLGPGSPILAMCDYDVAAGKPATEILRVAHERSCDLIVMGTHGLTGFRKLLLGSTTQRVLRETTTPVLLTPPTSPGPVSVEDASRLVGRIVAPVDLSTASPHQLRVARGAADALNVPLTVVHVIEPVKLRPVARLPLGGFDSHQQAVAEKQLDALLAMTSARPAPESRIVHGDPAEEVTRVVRECHAGLVIVGLHGSPFLGPRMGSVTYRMLCMSPTLTLALPPKPVVHADANADAEMREQPAAQAWSHTGAR